jgi:hypothetical protein
MIYRDLLGYPISVNDGYDSAVRAGILNIGDPLTGPCMTTYVDAVNPEMLLRHPWMEGANNPKNYTRDNMLVYMAGLDALITKFPGIPSYPKIARDFLKGRAKAFFFMQNTERDKRGSKKYLYPHKFYKDSKPNTDTSTIFNKVKLDPTKEIESRTFDGPDPLFFNHIWANILVARLKVLYFLGVIGIPCFIIMLLIHSFGNGDEENQMYAEARINGKWALRLYRRINKRWKARSFKYWNDRGELEYHNIIVVDVESA